MNEVFEHVTDSHAFFRGGPLRSVRILREGEPAPHGLGALREIISGPAMLPVRFVEEITAFEPNRLQEYTIRRCTLPLEHEVGRLRFTPRGDGTEIDWQSWFRIRLFVLSHLATELVAQTLTVEFTRLLMQAKAALEDARTPD